MSPRARLIEELEDWRLRHNARWALNLSLGISPLGHFDSESSFKPHLRKLMRQLSCEVFGIGRRQLKRLTPATAPFFAGLYEGHDKFGRPWPHIHGAMALGGQPEALLRGVLRDRWGRDEDPEKDGIIVCDSVGAPSPAEGVARRGVIKRLDYRPSFALKPIYSSNWIGGYAAKRSTVRDVSVWTTPEIMNLSAA